jgi:hypothetical protein
MMPNIQKATRRKLEFGQLLQKNAAIYDKWRVVGTDA